MLLFVVVVVVLLPSCRSCVSGVYYFAYFDPFSLLITNSCRRQRVNHSLGCFVVQLARRIAQHRKARGCRWRTGPGRQPVRTHTGSRHSQGGDAVLHCIVWWSYSASRRQHDRRRLRGLTSLPVQRPAALQRFWREQAACDAAVWWESSAEGDCESGLSRPQRVLHQGRLQIQPRRIV